MSANIVLQLRISQHDNAPIERYVRGRDTGMNWASGEGEIQSLFNQALAEAVGALYQELRPLCDTSTPEKLKGPDSI
jgi:hypothetical protein